MGRGRAIQKKVLVAPLDAQLYSKHTFVPDQPKRNAASWANNSPKPSISPLTNGSRRLIAAPLRRPQMVGGEYSISGELEEDGGDGESSLLEEE